MLSFMLHLTVRPECIEQAKKSLGEIDIQANTHEGMITFMWFQHIDNLTKFSLLEQWQNQELLDIHISKIIDIWKQFEPCLAEPPVSIKLNKLIQ